MMIVEAWDIPMDADRDAERDRASDRWTAICYRAEGDHALMVELATAR